MKKLTVNVNDKYDILIEKGLLGKSGELTKTVLKGRKIALISDTNVFPLYGDTVKNSLENQIIVPRSIPPVFLRKRQIIITSATVKK